MGMLLEAVDVDVDRPLRWRWLLRDEETGSPLADHQVDLDPGSVAVERFRDLFEYSRLYAAPDRRTQDGARYMAESGHWAGGELLGESIGTAIVADSPVTVRVQMPTALSPVLLWPLELAYVAGRPLAAYGDVTLVYDIAPDTPAQRKAETGAALRMLAVFSQPTQTSPLALRRERYELTRLVRRIAARERAAVELQVVQYGVTRERLKEIAGSGDGWDVLHLSGHGTGGAFWLEKSDGSPDLVTTADLVTLLRPARRRLRLAVVSACESAADTTAQTLRLLGLSEQADALEAVQAGSADEPVTSDGASAAQIPGLARALVGKLDCAVIAMRYPVTDEFAIAFGGVLYNHLLSRTHRHTVDVVVARAVTEAAGRGPSAALPAVSLVTPGVFGVRAVGLAMAVPRGEPVIDPAKQGMAYFPDEPPRFVGRAEAMAKAGAVLAPGKPDSGAAARDGRGGQDGVRARACLPAPGRVRRAGVLAGTDQRRRMGQRPARPRKSAASGGALPGSAGPGGVVLEPTAGRVVTLPVHALPRDEAVVLARELPNLRALLHADAGPNRNGIDADADRGRVLRVLRVVQGHPKLLELADAATGQADTGQLDAFFRDGHTNLNADQFLDALTGWTTASLSVLAPGERLMAEFVACLEDGDRRSDVIDATWADLRARLGRPGDPPAPGPLLDALATAALVEAAAFPVPGAEEQGAGGGHAGAGTGPGPVAYRAHPGVAAAIIAAAGPGVRDAADAGLAAFWVAVADQAREREGGEDTGLVVRAGLAAAPYLLRLGEWATAGRLLEDAVTRDGSPGTVQAALPALWRVTAATGTPRHTRVLARALRSVDPGEAERLLRAALAAVDAAGDYWAASAAADLVHLLEDAGRLAEALAVSGQMAEYTRRAGLGPWTRLAAKAQRLQVLGLMGEHARVLTEVAELRAAMAALPARPDASEGPPRGMSASPSSEPATLRRWRRGTGSSAWT